MKDIDLISYDMRIRSDDIRELKDRQQQIGSSSSSRAPPMWKDGVVGLDDEDLNPIMERLMGTESARLIIPIVGMGGIGKTTLARAIYENPFIMQYFDVRIWITITQKSNTGDVLLQIPVCQETSENIDEIVAEDELGDALYKSLYDRRYLIVIDDMWSVEVWDGIKFFLPDNENKSQVILTTRLSNVASALGPSSLYRMNFLNEKRSWKLFCEKTFAGGDCPLTPELENIGKKIVQKCKGLPLSIVVIGGLLAKSRQTLQYWESVSQDINSILNSENDEHCLNILSLSYTYLPIHLKSCFLYMGVFSEDYEIHASQLIKLWIAEGFLKPNINTSPEDVAEDYLKDLVDRNLILVRKWKYNRKIKTCYIHDLLRDVCLRVARKEKFSCVLREPNVPESMGHHRRIACHEDLPRALHVTQSARLVRSLICKGGTPPLKSKLLRVVNTVDVNYLKEISQHVNLRYLACRCRFTWTFQLPSSISLLWNLQTLICHSKFLCFALPEIWDMQRLRHVEFHRIHLPDPPVSHSDNTVLQNLQTFSKIINFKCSEEVFRRILYIKKLKIKYEEFPGGCKPGEYYCLNNLDQFQKLETLHFWSYIDPRMRRDLFLCLTFPHSLKKLTLESCALCWDDLMTFGSLPCLEVLKLEDSVQGDEWNPVEEQFRCLKYLKIHACIDLIHWNADRSHFPVVENLDFGHVPCLEEISPDVGDIPMLQSIRLGCCSARAAISAKKMLEEQESFGNEGLQVHVSFINETECKSFLAMAELEGPTSKNFHFSHKVSFK